MTELSKSEKEIYDLRREKVEKLKETESFPTYYKNASFISDIHVNHQNLDNGEQTDCLLYTSPSPRDLSTSRMPSSA